MSKQQKTELYQDSGRVYRYNRMSFGEYLRKSREYFNRTDKQVADLLGISLKFYLDLENDKRYPPTGELYKRICKVCDITESSDDEFALSASDFAGLQREGISLDTIEFLRRNWFARYVVNLLEQADNDGKAFLDEEDLCSVIRDSIYKISENKGVKIQLPEIDGDDE